MSRTCYLVVAVLAVSGMVCVPAADARESLVACTPVPFEAVSEIPGCGTRDASGQVRVNPSALARLDFNAGGLSSVLVEGVLLHVSRTGRTAQALPFDNGADYLVEGLTRVLINGKVGFVDANLDEAIPPSWDFAWPFGGGVAVVCLGCSAVADGEHSTMVGGRWGYIDRRGRVVVPVTFSKPELPSTAEARRKLRSGR